ncbi:MAG: hypothetical protein ACQETB_05015 [Halobacteriota archaeon]
MCYNAHAWGTDRSCCRSYDGTRADTGTGDDADPRADAGTGDDANHRADTGTGDDADLRADTGTPIDRRRGETRDVSGVERARSRWC